MRNTIYGKEETLEEKIDYLLPLSKRKKLVPAWPPDVFCVCAAILQCSGAFAAVVEDRQTFLAGRTSAERSKDIGDLAEKWRDSYLRRVNAPHEIQSWWNVLKSEGRLAISSVGQSRKCTGALLNLLAVADEACKGVGVYSTQPKRGAKKEELIESEFLELTEFLLLFSQSIANGATLCQEIHPSRGRVLPRMHTPQSGLTVRSLSHHLAYCPPSDICPEWKLSVERDDPYYSFNLLIVPWPKTVSPIQFKKSKSVSISDSVGGGGYGLFTYRLGKGPTLAYVKRLLAAAEKKWDVHGVIFPELAMSINEYSKIANGVVTPNRFVVAGVGKAAKSSSKCGANEAFWDIAVRGSGKKIFKGRFRQKKHHRWKLTKSQIVQYGLGANLHPEANWWEHISLEKRSLAFLNVRLWLTCTVLICEDLARPDPVGDLLRAVGPNLVIALLSDGPQTIGRWPGRYAGALADDPGSSVLTVTSSGMSRLSRPVNGTSRRSEVVALWRDPKTGARELEIDEYTDGLVLNITAEYDEEWTADGRGDGKSSGYPILSGYHQIKLTGQLSQRSGK